MNVPDNLLYCDTHEWVRVEGKKAVIGITDYAQEQLGDITYVDLPAGHWPQFTRPDEVADVILAAAAAG